ncbi:hypothetical protein CK203_009112 [Vitis vinifera]|uniref:Uncharacterized protein n=1 Tax=Vitis vinifera TaxID=29760 RepID=A0A438K2D1_VITVI|nr:hypothetical protein CK203_009112 [Vitis vinifera]
MRVGSVLANGFKELSKSPNQWKSSAKEDNWLGGKDIRWMVHIYDPTIFLKYFKEGFSVWWRDFWSERWEGYKFMKKLQFVKSKLKEWNKVSFGELKDRKKNILANIASIDAIE